MGKIEAYFLRPFRMCVLIAATALLFLAPLLSGDKVLGNFIGVEHQFQYTYFYQDAIRRGDSMLWNPLNFSGFPTFVDLNIGFFSPVVYGLAFLLSVPSLFAWLTFAVTALMGFGTAMLLREYGVRPLGQYVGALAYILSALVQIQDLNAYESFALLPLLLLFLARIRREERGWKRAGYALLGSIGIAQGWFGTHWHFLLNVLLVSGFYALYLAWGDLREKGREQWRIAVRPVLAYAGMAMLGTLIGLVKMIPALVFMGLSYRGSGFADISREGLALTNLLTLISPTFEHPLFFADPETVYIGILPLFLAFLAWRKSFFSKQGFFSWLLVVSIAIGARHSPFFAVLQKIPPFTFTHTASRWVYIAGFAIAMLAGFGIEECFGVPEPERARKHARQWSLIAGILFAASAAAAALARVFMRFHAETLFLAKAYFDRYIYRPGSALSIDAYHAYLERMLNKGIHMADVHNGLFAVALISIACAWVALRLFCRRADQRAVLVLVAVVAFNVSATELAFGEKFDRSIFEREPATVEFLKGRPGRVFSFLEGAIELPLLERYAANDPRPEEKVPLADAMLLPMRNLKYGIETAGYNGTIADLRMSRMMDYIGGAVFHTEGISLSPSPLSIPQKAEVFARRRPILDLLGIRYILSAYPLDSFFPKVFETTAASYGIPIYVYENKDARPYAYFTEEASLLNLEKETHPERVVNLLDDKTVSLEGIAVKERKNALLRLETDAKESKLLVVSANNLPGWRAFIDGLPVRIDNFATVYQTVRVPAGTHSVTFEYSYQEIIKEFWRMIRAKI